jgi:DNA-binding XRE family transcriptional regulator
VTQKYRAYREIRQEFSPERQQKISAGAAKINIARQAAGLTQEELAELLGIVD